MIWGIIAGDSDGTGDVANSDKDNVWNIQSGTGGYLEGDYNLNNNVNNKYKNDLWFKNNGKVTYIPE